MTTQQMAGLKGMKALAALADSRETFLTVYLNTQGETVPADVQARLADLLWKAQQQYAGGRWEATAKLERGRVLPVAHAVRPVGPGLVIVSSEGAKVLESHSLPGGVEDRVRVGLGVDALQLLDLIDEHEPIAVAFVENDKARLLLVAAGRVIEAEHFESDVPGKENAGGWRHNSYDRHRLDHVHRHLKRVAEALEAFHGRHGFRRLVLGGPPEPLSAFKKELGKAVAGLVTQDIGMDAHASDAQIAAHVGPAAEHVERTAEVQVVNDLVVAAEKGQGAVLGTAPTLAALHDRELHSCVIDPHAELQGALCPACDRLLPAEAIRCPDCGGAVERVDLRGELPRHLQNRQVALELVHGDAASAMWGHGSIGGLLKLHKH